MLGLIEIIFSCIGIYGVFIQDTLCMIIGLVGIIIGDFIDIFITKHNPTTIVLACMFGIGVSIANKNPIYGFTIALCGENILMSIYVLLAIGVGVVFYRKEKLEEESKKSEVIHELMQRSNLSYAICSDILNILISFQNRR